MATYDRLPVYRASYDFLVETFAFVKTFPREYEYTLGESIKKELLDLIRSVSKSSSGWTKWSNEFPNSSSIGKAASRERNGTGPEPEIFTDFPGEPLSLLVVRPNRALPRRPGTKSGGTLFSKGNRIPPPAKPPPSVLAGNRNNSSAAYNNQGTNGNYWASSPTGTNGYNVNLSATQVNPANNNNRANWLSVRCLKNQDVPVRMVKFLRSGFFGYWYTSFLCPTLRTSTSSPFRS